MPDTFGEFSRPGHTCERLGLANTLEEMGEFKLAAEHYREMLRLNPGDNQGVRYLLLPTLLRLGRLDEVQRLLDDPEYADDASASWGFGRALLAFSREGNSASARKLLTEAMKSNKHVSSVLLSRDELPPPPESYSMGSAEEAIIYANERNTSGRQSPAPSNGWAHSNVKEKRQPDSEKESVAASDYLAAVRDFRFSAISFKSPF